MDVVVLTGGIGSGKSVAAEYFCRRGAFVIDLDDVATAAMDPGSPLLASVVSEFGGRVMRSDGALDRAALASACFSDAETARRLNRIVHPAVARRIAAVLSELELRPDGPRVVIVEVPLLAEAPEFAELGDLVVAITAPEAVRVERAVSRGMERSDVLRRARVQAPDSARVARADVVIENDGTLEDYVAKLSSFWDGRFGVEARHE